MTMSIPEQTTFTYMRTNNVHLLPFDRNIYVVWRKTNHSKSKSMSWALKTVGKPINSNTTGSFEGNP